MKYLSALIVIVSITSINAHAAIFYRHLPFDMSIRKNDVIVVNYDFSDSKGISCSSDKNAVWIDFIYKGFQKSVRLPVNLINDHVPDKEHEELADVNRRFTLSIKENSAPESSYAVKCDYIKKIH
jgi:hypothetical protein